mgnify:CR=1 FL=1
MSIPRVQKAQSDNRDVIISKRCKPGFPCAFSISLNITTYFQTGRNAEAPGSLYPEFESVRTRALVLKLLKEEDVDEYGQPNADDAERCSVRGYVCFKNKSLLTSLFPNVPFPSPSPLLSPVKAAVVVAKVEELAASSPAVKDAKCPAIGPR